MERPSQSLFAGVPLPHSQTGTGTIGVSDPFVAEHTRWHRLLSWTIPPAMALTAVYWPFFTRLEAYKVLTMMAMAMLGTAASLSCPFSAPAADPMHRVLLFATHAYNTSLVYAMLTKRLVVPTYLARRTSAAASLLGRVVIAGLLGLGALHLRRGGGLTGRGAILVAACPVLMLQWILCSRFFLALPRRTICLAVGLPSIYMSMASILSLGEDRQVLRLRLLAPPDFEYGATPSLVFWLVSAVFILGLVLIDHAVAISESCMARDSASHSLFGVVRVYMAGRELSHGGVVFLHGLSEAVETVSQKSQSMYMGSAMFQGGLRIDLLLLYYFCRVMDDLVDEAPDHQAAELAIRQCSWALRCRFGEPCAPAFTMPSAASHFESQSSGDEPDLLPPSALMRSISLLPATRLTLGPLLGLVDGFRTDLAFSSGDSITPPISTEKDLEGYAYNVAGVVALSIVQLIFNHHPSSKYSANRRAHILKAAGTMGQALQYVNMARDVERDAAMGRVYLPQTWLGEEGLKVVDVIAAPQDPRVTKLRIRLLDRADAMYESSRTTMDQLPRQARAPVRAVVESYMAIGKEVRKGPRMMSKEKLKLSVWRRLWVVWRAMCAT